MQSYAEVCEFAARQGGEVLLEWLGRFEVREKAPKDLVTEADLASQQRIESIILQEFPDHGFQGEEDDPQTRVRSGSGSPFTWIVDPLDGTTNYVHQFPNFSVSVAMALDGEVRVGTVFDPVRNECFSAIAGQGAYLNGAGLRVSGCDRLSEALVAASFSASVRPESEEISRFVAVLAESQAVRRLGSAALNLAYLAAGRLDAYWATSVKSWDVAAGLLLVREAGGVVTNVGGEPFQLARPAFAAAATTDLHAALLRCLADQSP